MHGRIGEARRQQGFDVRAQAADGIFNAFERLRIGDTKIFMETRRNAAQLAAAFDLRTRAVHEHEFDAEAVEQRDIVNDVREIRMLDRIATEHQDKRFTAVRIDIGRRIAKPFDVILAGAVHGRYPKSESIGVLAHAVLCGQSV
jgi:hypothetical protein